MKAIEVIQESRKSHISWIDYYARNPGSENLPENKAVGDMIFHKECG